MKLTSRPNFNDSIIRAIVKSYSPLDYSPKLIQLLSKFYPLENFGNCNKTELHKIINDAVFKGYQGEQVLKYALFKHVYKKDLIAAFEMRVNSSRVDFLTINGYSTGYEIKSALDNLDKLAKQSADYRKVFDFNNIVIDKCHLENCLELLPEDFGVIIINGSRMFRHRSPRLNDEIDPRSQLSLLTSKELKAYFPRYSNIEECLLTMTPEAINACFKHALKARYRSRWNFLLENQSDILPIDIQFFFKTNIDPQFIYTTS